MTREERHQCYKALERIINECSNPNWNGYSADAISMDVVYKTLGILNVQSYQPFISPTLRNSIQFDFDFQELDLHLEFEVSNNDAIPYLVCYHGVIKEGAVSSGKDIDTKVKQELHKHGGELYDNQY